MRSIFLALAMLTFATTSATAQRGGPGEGSSISGIEVKGNVHFNRSTITPTDDSWKARNAYGLGIEYVFGQLGVGLYGHADGRSGPAISDTTAYFLSAEANYYLPVGGPGLALYIGGHANLGTFDRTWFDDPYAPDFPDSVDSLGYQLGIRYKPASFVGIDLQWRHQSREVWDAQEGFLDRDQLLLGVVLF